MASEVYQMAITSDDPARFLPPSWNFYQAPGMSVWGTALDIAKWEKVEVTAIHDEQGKEVPLDV